MCTGAVFHGGRNLRWGPCTEYVSDDADGAHAVRREDRWVLLQLMTAAIEIDRCGKDKAITTSAKEKHPLPVCPSWWCRLRATICLHVQASRGSPEWFYCDPPEQKAGLIHQARSIYDAVTSSAHRVANQHKPYLDRIRSRLGDAHHNDYG